MNQLLLYIAATICGLWGAAHLFATKGVVAGFGDLSDDNRRIITMEWIVERAALLSIAGFVVVATILHKDSILSSAVYAVAIVSLFTGFRIAFLPFRLCPFIFSLSATLIAIGAWF